VTGLQYACLAAVAVTGTFVVLMRDPLRQLVVAGFFGLALAALFLAFGAPDVALSQMTVSAVMVPAMVLLALAKLADQREEDDG
jgi:uncharacterized MnhB-related membrane protein